MGTSQSLLRSKVRRRTVTTGNAAVNALRRYCDDNDLIFQAEPREDFGIDCYVEVGLDGSPTNFLIGVQCKGGRSYRRNLSDGRFAVRVRPSDAAYWLAANYPVFFVYHDPDEDRLYFKHIQSVFGSVNGITGVKRLIFDRTDDAHPTALADAARRIAVQTPSVVDRLEVAGAVPVLSTGLVNTPLTGLSSNRRLLRFADLLEPSCLRPHLEIGSVAGFSDDDRWVVMLHESYVGLKCVEVRAQFLDTSNWLTLTLPVFLEADYDEYGEELPPKLHRKRMAAIQAQIRRFLVRPPGVAWTFQSSDGQARADLHLAFATQRFHFAMSRFHGRDTLTLENRRYTPPRRAALFVAPVITSAYFGESLDQVDAAMRFQLICEIALSRSGQRLVVGVMTNPDNACWGSPVIRHVHVLREELRRLCIESLLA